MVGVHRKTVDLHALADVLVDLATSEVAAEKEQMTVPVAGEETDE